MITITSCETNRRRSQTRAASICLAISAFFSFEMPHGLSV